jgi:HSP20 family protein
MAETNTKVPVKTEKTLSFARARRPFARLRREIDSLFEDFFGGGVRRSPSRRSFFDFGASRRAKALGAIPAVDVTETDKAYEITSELPGMDEENIEVKLANGVLTIRGEEHEEKEEKKKGYYMRERSYSSFERTFQVPDDVETDKIEASFKKGVLIVTLPKTAEAQKAEKKIEVKTG